jgi:hypothetical protein
MHGSLQSSVAKLSNNGALSHRPFYRACRPNPTVGVEFDIAGVPANGHRPGDSQKLPHYDWVGFYTLDPGDSEMLILGPFAGAPMLHVHIPVHRGISAAGVASRAAVVADDVNADPRYRACSIATPSEIVVPIFVRTSIAGEIDINSHTPAAFRNDGWASL